MRGIAAVMCIAALATLGVYAGTSSSATNSSTQLAALRPPIHQWPIPFGAARKHEMAAYSQEHYGEDT